MLGKDANWIVAGLVAALGLPAFIWLGMPFVIALPVVLTAFAGLVILLAPKRLFEGFNVAGIGKQRLAFARDLLSEAAPSAERLDQAARTIANAQVKHQVAHLSEIASDIFARVEANPATASSVRRFLSYYLPKAADISEGYVVLERKRSPNPDRVGEVTKVIQKLEDAFVHYADSLAETELGTLDVDLRLLEASLKEDLER